MDDLIAFVSARLDEDEAAARAATPGPWRATGQRDHFVEQAQGDHIVAEMYGCADHPDMSERDAGHIARHDPARALREVQILRVLITSHHYDRGRCDSCEYGCPVAALAGIWSDHPDYQREWAV